MYLFNEKEQPYGLLSNFAITPIYIKGTWWQSVNEYIFTNMVTDTSMKQRMRREIYTTIEPYLLLEEIENEVWGKKFLEGLKVALSAKIEERPELQNMIKKSSWISYKSELELEDFFNQKRNELLDREEKFSMIRIKRIIDGVTKALRTGVKIDPSSTLAELKEYETMLPPSNIKEDDEIFSHLHELVPYIQFKINTEPIVNNYLKSLKTFKLNVFDKYLINKLRLEYPDLEEKYYPDARTQMLETMDNNEIDNLIDNIYTLFLDGELHAEVIQAVGNPPQNPELNFVSKGVREITITNRTHPLSPYRSDPVFIHGIKYHSVLHYTYGEMLKEIGIRIDVNSIKINELTKAFRFYYREYLTKNLWMYAEIGIKAKLKHYTVLGHLLKTTGNQEIIWGDISDPVLGVGKDGKGENIVGQSLMKYRDSMTVPDKKVSSYLSPMHNIFVKQWVLMRLGDIYNSMTALIKPTTDSLADLYRFPQSNIGKNWYDRFSGLYPQDRQILADSFPELTDELLAIAWPLMYTQIYVIKRLNDSELVNIMVKAQEIYLGKVPSTDEKHTVTTYFQNYFTRHRDNMKLNDSTSFIGRILSGNKYTKVQSSYDTFSYALNPRVFYWLDLAKQIKV